MKKLLGFFNIALAGIVSCNNGIETPTDNGLKLSAEEYTFDSHETNAKTVTVTGADWNAVSSSSWIIISSTQGSAGDSFSVEVAPNEGAPREGFITVSDIIGVSPSKNITINQLSPEWDIIYVNSVVLEEEMTLPTGTSLELSAQVFPPDATNRTLEWSVGDPSVASVSGNIITGLKKGTTTVRATTTDGTDITATATIDVSWTGEVTFRTETTWNIGNQIWSDTVLAQRCKKDDYYGGTYGNQVYEADCAQNTGYGDMFSWLAVETYGNDICPDGWQIPSPQHFTDMDIALGWSGEMRSGAEAQMAIESYVTQWGADFAGYFWFYQNVLNRSYVGQYASYWAKGESSATQGYGMQFSLYGVAQVNVVATPDKYNGFNVRCVKEA